MWNASLNQNLLHPALAPVDCAGVKQVVASDNAHGSVAKAAKIPGLRFRSLRTDAERIERCMALAKRLAQAVHANDRFELLMPPQTGVVVWRPRDRTRLDALIARLPPAAFSVTMIDDERWIRRVVANPDADVDTLADRIGLALDTGARASIEGGGTAA